jgi:hypothetical protein
MVILGLPGYGNLELPILARRRRVTTERSIAGLKFCHRENAADPPSFIFGSGSQRERASFPKERARPPPLPDGLFADDAVIRANSG